MPTIPLYKHPTNPNASHDVASPGGYEFWHFDAQDPEHDRVVIVRFIIGNVFVPRYLKRYERYRRHPTRNAPPVPREFVAVEVVAYDAGRRFHEVEFFNGDCSASMDRLDLDFWSNTVRTNGAGELTLSAAPCSRSPHLSVRFTFTPRIAGFEPGERALFEELSTEGEHRWIIAAPLCDVTGEVRAEQPGSSGHAFAFRGVGYHDHHYGTAPLGSGLRGAFRGRVLDPEGDRCLAFQVARPRDARATDECHVIEIAGGTARELRLEQIEVDWPGWRSHFGPPRGARFGDQLVLTYAKGLALTTTSAHAAYEVGAKGKRFALPALCEMVHPR